MESLDLRSRLVFNQSMSRVSCCRWGVNLVDIPSPIEMLSLFTSAYMKELELRVEYMIFV